MCPSYENYQYMRRYKRIEDIRYNVIMKTRIKTVINMWYYGFITRRLDLFNDA